MKNNKIRLQMLQSLDEAKQRLVMHPYNKPKQDHLYNKPCEVCLGTGQSCICDHVDTWIMSVRRYASLEAWCAKDKEPGTGPSIKILESKHWPDGKIGLMHKGQLLRVIDAT